MSLETSAQILDGLAVAQRIKEEARISAAELARRGARPRLRVILLGNTPASETYVASKTRAARECGCLAETIR
ncbi:MAG: tetrahydrofolate dehydrogenase/cyclohydrolase catalytic domain-containing protein, partial [Thermoanaerobaculia bacterium]